jgi:hypothetical protein
LAARKQANLALRLKQRGLAQASKPWLIADLSVLPAPPSVLPELRVVVAESPVAMNDWWHVFG